MITNLMGQKFPYYEADKNTYLSIAFPHDKWTTLCDIKNIMLSKRREERGKEHYHEYLIAGSQLSLEKTEILHNCTNCFWHGVVCFVTSYQLHCDLAGTG